MLDTKDKKALAAELKTNLSRLIDRRSTWEEHWQEVADLVIPRKSDIVDQKVRGDKRHLEVFDATAIHSLELLASSLHGMLTSSANRWFSLRYKEVALNEDDEAKEWLEDVTDKMYVALHRSNFQQEIFEAYHDLCAFGTAGMINWSNGSGVFLPPSPSNATQDILGNAVRDRQSSLNLTGTGYAEVADSASVNPTSAITIQCWIFSNTENDKGLVDCIYRRFKLTAKAAVQKFGFDNLSRNVQNVLKNSPFNDIEFVHVVKPRDIYNPKKEDKENMPFISIYMEMESANIISIGGFREFPYVVPRFLKASNEIYGRSPGMNSLPDVKVLNKMVEVGLKAAQKQVDPPLLVPDDAMMLPIRTAPGSLNYFRSGSRDRIEPLNIGANNPLGLNMEEQRRKAISQTFHVDQLLITENRNMTATEVAQRSEEKMRILGPTLGRLQILLLLEYLILCLEITYLLKHQIY